MPSLPRKTRLECADNAPYQADMRLRGRTLPDCSAPLRQGRLTVAERCFATSPTEGKGCSSLTSTLTPPQASWRRVASLTKNLEVNLGNPRRPLIAARHALCVLIRDPHESRIGGIHRRARVTAPARRRYRIAGFARLDRDRHLKRLRRSGELAARVDADVFGARRPIEHGNQVPAAVRPNRRIVVVFSFFPERQILDHRR